MPVRNNLLKKHKNYYFSVFYGIDVSTIEKINYKSFGINCIKIFSPEFDKLSTEIEDWEYMVKEEFDLIKFYHAEDISCLFYSETENSIADFYNFLTILRPSNVKEWLTFDTFYSKSNNNSTNLPHHTNGYSIWKTIHELYNNLKNEDIFYLSGKDILFVNKLIIKYSSLK